MAHQAHNIPWTLVASNLRWVSPGSMSDCTNLRIHTRQQRGKELMHFLEAFARNIDEHSTCERQKYADKYDPPEMDSVILDAGTINKISRTICRWRHSYKSGFGSRRPWVCPRDRLEKCQCYIIPERNRRASAFLLQYEPVSFSVNSDYFYNLEIVKTLLLHGEMDTILRVCAHPRVDLKHGWDIIDDCGCCVSISLRFPIWT
jgi:hypothetical protein